MSIYIGNTDLFGYYTVGNEKTYSKPEAIQLMEKTGIHLEWHFNDEAFSSYDWTIEPTETLEELYRQRAENLRNKYDYIVLSFSGGADSTTVLDTFINNNIHLDEIFSFVWYEGNKSQTHRLDSEITLVAKPYAEKIVEAHPTMKYRTLDFSRYTYDFFSDQKNADHYMYQNTSVVVATGLRTMSYETVPFYLDLVNSGKKICFLNASDKPRVFEENGKYFFQFIDMLTVYPAGSNAPVELFYWSPDGVKILIKQSHIIKRYLEQATPATPFMTWKSTGLAYKMYQGKKLWLTVEGIHKLIYETWDINTYTIGKTPSPVFCPSTSWLYRDTHDGSPGANYLKAVNHWWKELPDYWRNDPNDISRGIKGCLSKKYFLN
jgi:hypothetical protein